MVLRVKQAAYSIESVQKGLAPLKFERFDVDVHYELYSSWWKKRMLTPPPPEVLSDIGIVISDHAPCAIGFCYVSNSLLGHIGYACASPSITAKRRVFALFMLARQAEQFLTAAGCVDIHTYSSDPALTKIFGRMGFTKQQDHSFLVKHLGDKKNGT